LRHEGKRREIIPLHGAKETERQSHDAARDPWRPYAIVEGAPADLRPLVLDLLGAMGLDATTVSQLREVFPGSPEPAQPEQLAAAMSLVRASVDAAARNGAAGEDTRARHACLDAACLAWAEDALELQASAQRRFLRDVSHDIRSPLNSILFLADALRSRHSGDLNSVQSRQIDVLYMASVTLVKLVNDLIDYSHLNGDAGVSVANSPFSVESVVDDVHSLIGPLLAYHEVTLEVECTETNPRSGDAQILNRVLLNLLSNAVNALPEGGRVWLKVWDGPDGSLEASVTDDGLNADIERIRNALRVAVNGGTMAETQGWTHGLGLSISARLVAAAGGTLEAEPAESGGTRMRLSLPFGVL
jgi:signal transduction histidine kinase